MHISFKVEDLLLTPVERKGRFFNKTTITLLDQDDRVHQIAVETLHPYRNLSDFSKQIHVFIDRLFGRTIVELKLKETSADSIFIRVNSLKRVIGEDLSITKELEKGKTGRFVNNQKTKLQFFQSKVNQITTVAAEKGLILTQIENELSQLLSEMGPESVEKIEKIIRCLAHQKDARLKRLEIDQLKETLREIEAESEELVLKEESIQSELRLKKDALMSQQSKKSEHELYLQEMTKEVNNLQSILPKKTSPIKLILNLFQKTESQDHSDLKQSYDSQTEKLALAHELGKKISGNIESFQNEISELEEKIAELKKKRENCQKKIEEKKEIKKSLITEFNALEASVKDFRQGNRNVTHVLDLYEGKTEFFSLFLNFKKIMSPEEKVYLTKLADKVSYHHLNEILRKIGPSDEKAVMFRTFIAIGEQLEKNSDDVTIFNESIKHHAFVIHNNQILVSEGKKLGEGSFKLASTAIKLNDLVRHVKLEVKTNTLNSLKAEKVVEEAKAEVKLLEILHKAKPEDHIGRSCLVPPYLCQVMTSKQGEKPVLVMFQKQMDGDGDKLKGQGVNSFQQLHALKDVAFGLAYLHEMGYVHMDMKPANFLIKGNVSETQPVEGKLTDFGGTVGTGEKIKVVTLDYLPPEALKKENGKTKAVWKTLADPKIDSFSLGVTVFEIVGGKLPSLKYFGSMKEVDIQNIIQNKIKEIKNCQNLLNKDKKRRIGMLKIACDLMKTDPKERLSCKEAADRLSALTT
ncbi:MAG: protein kinase [Parachlamydiaceae bacterium]